MMNSDYWLERVINKLYASFLKNDVLSSWIPDQDDPNEESRALDTLEIAGIIKSPAYFEGADYRIQDLKGNNELARFAPTRKIIDFDYDKFMRFCEASGLSPTAKGVSAQLEIIDEVQPIVTMDGKRYVLKSLNDSGLPQKVIAYAWKNPDRRITLDELRINIGMNQIQNKAASLLQTFDKKNIFGKHGILRAFAEIEVRSFLIKRNVSLTPDEVAQIKTAGTN